MDAGNPSLTSLNTTRSARMILSTGTKGEHLMDKLTYVKQLLAHYWHSKGHLWPPSNEMLRMCQSVGIDPLEVIKSYHHKREQAGIPERCTPWTDVR